jgi:hypothetical protein
LEISLCRSNEKWKCPEPPWFMVLKFDLLFRKKIPFQVFDWQIIALKFVQLWHAFVRNGRKF